MTFNEFLLETIDSPLGSIEVVSRPDAVVSIDFLDCHERMAQLLFKRFGAYQLKPGHSEFSEHLQSYFAGQLDALAKIPYCLKGTEFQNKVWQSLTEINPGETLTYGDIAKKLGKPRAAQAVGRANSLNPILLVIPCHRIIGKQTQLVGYSAGVERKQWLLSHESGVHQQEIPSLSH